jgi:hypothetical protein
MFCAFDERPFHNAFRYDQYPYYIEREWWKEGNRMTFWSNWKMLKDVKRRQALHEYGPMRSRLKALKENRILPQAMRVSDAFS